MAEIVPQTFLVFDGVLVRYFVDCPSSGVSLMCFSWFNWSYGFWEEDHGDKRPFSSHHIKGTCYQHDLSLLMLTLIMEIVFVRFLHSKVALSGPFAYCPLRKDIIMGSPLKDWGVMFPLFEGGTSPKITWDFFCPLDVIGSLFNRLTLPLCWASLLWFRCNHEFQANRGKTKMPTGPRYCLMTDRWKTLQKKRF